MKLIKKIMNLVAVLCARTQCILMPSRLLVYFIGFSIFLTAGNAFCNASIDDWNRISGPIAVVNQTPIQLLFLQPIPDRAETYPQNRYSISLNTAVSNTLLWQKSEHYFGYDDMEMIRSSLELRYGIFSRFEVDMSIPFVYGYGGVMDHDIHEFEKLWFESSRDLRDKEDMAGRINNYTFFVQKDGKTFIQGEERGSGLGDLALTVKGKILDEGDIVPCLSARVSVKIPTGDDKRALGSGKMDYGIGLLLQKTFKKSFTAYLNADVIFPGQAFSDEDISLIPFYEMMLGGEYKFSERFSGLFQLSYITRPFENTGLVMLDDRMWYMLLGVNYLTKIGVYIQGGLIQDSFDSSDAGADITFFLNVGKNF